MGFLYKQKSRDGTPGQIWWVKYYRYGRPIRESTGTANEILARRLLKEREGRVATGQPILPRADRIRYDEVAEDLRRHYQTTGARDVDEADFRLTHLRAFFSGRNIAGLGPADVTTYALKRQAEDASTGTLNRELAILNRMLRLAYENGKLLPLIRQLKEPGPRQGFFEPGLRRPEKFKPYT